MMGVLVIPIKNIDSIPGEYLFENIPMLMETNRSQPINGLGPVSGELMVHQLWCGRSRITMLSSCSISLASGCTNIPGSNADKQQSAGSDNQSAAGSGEQEGTESEHEGNSEKRADFSFDNKTPSVRQLTMTATDDSDTVVSQKSYQLDPQQ